MKFVKYLAIAFAGVLMTSCDEDFNDWASPIKNPEEEAITIPGYTATAAEGAVIDMANAPATVKVLTLAGERYLRVLPLRIFALRLLQKV